MASLNKVLLAGNITKDPEIRYTPSGTAVGDLRLAINRKYKASDGSIKDDPVFVDVEVWDKTAQRCGESLHKGSGVLVEGRLKLDSWEKDGKKFNRLRVVAERLQFLDSKGSGRTSPAKESSEDTSEENVSSSDNKGDEDNLPF